MGGYAPSPRKGTQLELSAVPATDGCGFACDLCTNPTPSGVAVGHVDGAGVAVTDAGICNGCLQRQGCRANDRLRATGAAYRDGRLSAAEVANILNVSVSAAVGILEQTGYARPGIVRYTRDERLSKMRKALAGTIPKDIVLREFLATSRIEGIDVLTHARTAYSLGESVATDHHHHRRDSCNSS